MAQQSPEDQDRALFGLFGDNEEKEGNHETAATYSDDEAQIEAASYLPTPPQHHHGVEHCHGHGQEGQLTPEEAEQQKQAKLHRTHSSSSTSSSDEEDEGEKKKGAKDKIKEKLPGGGEHSSDECGGIEEEKEVGLLDKIKEKLPGKHETKIEEEKKVDESKIEEEKKVDEGRIEEEEKVDESRIEEEKKVSLLDKIKEKLPGHRNKKDLEEEEKKQQY